MLDYERVKKYFADKLAADFAGEGRFESAFYHTIFMVYESAISESDQRIARMESDLASLRRALTTTSEGNARLMDEAHRLRVEATQPAPHEPTS